MVICTHKNKLLHFIYFSRERIRSYLHLFFNTKMCYFQPYLPISCHSLTSVIKKYKKGLIILFTFVLFHFQILGLFIQAIPWRIRNIQSELKCFSGSSQIAEDHSLMQEANPSFWFICVNHDNLVVFSFRHFLFFHYRCRRKVWVGGGGGVI